jgi:hypothetical protein
MVVKIFLLLHREDMGQNIWLYNRKHFLLTILCSELYALYLSDI